MPLIMEEQVEVVSPFRFVPFSWPFSLIRGAVLPMRGRLRVADQPGNAGTEKGHVRFSVKFGWFSWEFQNGY